MLQYFGNIKILISKTYFDIVKLYDLQTFVPIKDDDVSWRIKIISISNVQSLIAIKFMEFDSIDIRS